MNAFAFKLKFNKVIIKVTKEKIIKLEFSKWETAPIYGNLRIDFTNNILD